jgi:hypothetical protein
VDVPELALLQRFAVFAGDAEAGEVQVVAQVEGGTCRGLASERVRSEVWAVHRER